MAHRADGLNDIFEHDVTVRENLNTKGGTVSDTPVGDTSLVNKKYVDDEVHWERTGTNVHLKTSTDKVGIGTDAPQEHLHVSGTGTQRFEIEATDTGAAVLKLTNTDGGYALYSSLDKFHVYSNTLATEALSILPSGNVGIGTSSPSAALEVAGEAYFTAAATASPGIFLKDSVSSHTWKLRQSTANDFQIRDVTAATSRLTIDTSGHVGIGTSSPTRKLDIVQDADTEDSGIGIYNAAENAIGRIWMNGADMIFQRGGDNEQQLVLDATGNVGIGSTAPQGKLHVGEQATNYFKVASDGTLTLHGTARVNRHLRIGAGSLKLGASSPTVGITGVFPHLSFSQTSTQQAYYQILVPNRWDSSTDIEICFDWLYTGGQDNGTVKWGLEYNSKAEGEDPTAGSTTITQVSPGTHTTGQLVRTCITTKILASNLTAEDTFGMRIFRDQANDTLATGAILLGVHFHFTENKLGG